MIKPMTQTELVKRLKGIQTGIWKGYEYQSEFWEDDEQWVTVELNAQGQPYGPAGYAFADWEAGLSKHLNRFYDNEMNPGPKWQQHIKDICGNKDTQ